MRPHCFKGFLLCLGVLVLLSALVSELDVLNNLTYRYSIYTTSGGEYKSSIGSYSSIPKRALTKEDADVLRGTGYHGTRPNSAVASMELAAAQVKCDICGMHSTNGHNSACNSCRAKGYH